LIRTRCGPRLSKPRTHPGSGDGSILTTNNFQTIYDYQILFRLLDGTEPVPLRMTNGTISTNLVLSSTVILPDIFTTSKTNNRIYVGQLAPAAPLDPYRQYTVDVRLFERTNGVGAFTYTGDSASEAPHLYRHFASTNSNDAATNVIAILSSAPVTQMFAVDTIADKDAFRCVAGLTLLRYDYFTNDYVIPPADNIAVALDFELRDSVTDAVVPLSQSTTNVLIAVPRHAKQGSFRVPAVVNAAQAILIKPAPSAQLDPLRMYRTIVRVRHRETAAVFKNGNSVTNAPIRFLHFNGDLFFGSVLTRFTSIDNIPGPAFILPNGTDVSGG
jgi:hypothetical protein